MMPKQMKHELNDLAFFGGKPAFKEPLHVGRPNIGNRDTFLARVNDILDRRWLTNYGPMVQDFEHRVASFVGVKHCVAMCNGTVALEIATRAVGMKGEVIVPSFTFIATAHALQWQEITPVFCDIDPKTYCIDPSKVESLITPRTTGIIGVHLWGRVCDVTSLTEIARRHKVKLLFDAAHALGCSHNGRMIGSFGDAEVFSFHATKFLNSLEGGAVVTNDEDLAHRIRLMKNFGFFGHDNVIYIGTNGKMNEVAAAMGLTSLESIEEFIEVNRRNYHLYQEALTGIPGVRLVPYETTDKSNYQNIVLEIDDIKAGVSRDQLLEILHAENVIARRYFYPGCHRMEPYRSYFPHAHLLLPETERLARQVLSLPTGTAVGPNEISQICGIIRFVVAESVNVQKRHANSDARGHHRPDLAIRMEMGHNES
jgi:dTDP-4-amino-4,6-dideoxygalactose transaminase